MDPIEWRKTHELTPERFELARLALEEVRAGMLPERAVRRYPQANGRLLPKSVLVATYRELVESGEWPADAALAERIRMKPVRTLSGVATVTVMTKPYPCPGDCIFCPTDERMPKSYLADEPGVMRGWQNEFDPFRQVSSRLKALDSVGHPTDKIELLILGGTWNAYPKAYQEEFIWRCFDALNGGEPAASLEEAQARNENAAHRNVGLVIETRPDRVTPAELAWLRRLGVTKVQMGAQSLDDRILKLNNRGHTAAQTLRATALLRAAGFKIVLHWMPNLLGATIEADHADFERLWREGYAPDEIKIYPCQLLAKTGLYDAYLRGEYEPYSEDQLVHLIADLKAGIPGYCRVNRVIRDIPSHHVVHGNRRTSLRMDALAELEQRGQRCGCVRCREVRGEQVETETLRLADLVYRPAEAEEHFLHFLTPVEEGERIAGYLRLSLPAAGAPDVTGALPELAGAALVREVHVYGQALQVGAEKAGAAQHAGLGTRLLAQAEELARAAGFGRLAVIAAVGTRGYYRARGFEPEGRYYVKDLV